VAGGASMGVRQRLGMAQALQAQRAMAGALEEHGGRRRSVKDGSIEVRQGFALVARAALCEAAGQVQVTTANGCDERGSSGQHPACLRSMNAVASAQASRVVDTTAAGVVNPGLDSSE
jgi:hypothetical protein